ncbi:DciA family protein [Bordetella genomosp. 9]|uniref:Flagellar hook-length control protein FliK n=1 Tax=Bordetella genomosp. 9 TaxID=1416803 RepID=A0A1W6Z5A8_9BORD|nr:DciA family protein [Bordetella genomosp. 9]ARP88540.1 flagellar hook-length control protein FliK [Bordetella genomosp. 9]ARP89591.1 flagellar hook-length control protein FliK [Bordetella genomosp. 9]
MKRSAAHRPFAKPPRADHTALGWLGHDARGAGVLATARLHLQIQRAVAAAVPPALGAVCRVARLEHDRLQLAVPSAAHAAKLRQMAPRIAQALQAGGWNLNEIAVKVQAGLPGAGTKPARPPKEAVPLDETALNAFQALRETLHPGPLADAVERLLRHHRQG